MKLYSSQIKWIASILACLFYGGWAAFANANYGFEAAAKAFVIQGLFAFVSTLGLSQSVIWLMKKYHFVYVFFQMSLVLIAVPFLMHNSASTPNIFIAMLPGLLVGHLYLLGLIKSLLINQNNN